MRHALMDEDQALPPHMAALAQPEGLAVLITVNVLDIQKEIHIHGAGRGYIGCLYGWTINVWRRAQGGGI